MLQGFRVSRGRGQGRVLGLTCGTGWKCDLGKWWYSNCNGRLYRHIPNSIFNKSQGILALHKLPLSSRFIINLLLFCLQAPCLGKLQSSLNLFPHVYNGQWQHPARVMCKSATTINNIYNYNSNNILHLLHSHCVPSTTQNVLHVLSHNNTLRWIL